MCDFKEVITFRPVYDGVIYDSEADCKWAIFFEELNLKYEYKPQGYSTGLLQPTFKVFYSDNVGNYELFFVQKNTCVPDKWVFDELVQFSLKAPSDIMLLDGPPEKGMYVRINYVDVIDCEGWSGAFDFIKDLMTEPGKRQGCAVWSDKSRIWWDSADNFFKGGAGAGAAIEIEQAVCNSKDSFQSGLDLFLAEMTPQKKGAC